MIKRLLRRITPTFLRDAYHLLPSFIGAVYYRFPSRKIKVIAVTGTNGKSSVVSLTKYVLEEAGFKVATSSSIFFQIGDKQESNNLRMTMPGGFYIQGFLRRAINAKCDYAILETTSEGIKQYRHKFIDFEAAAFTNLTPEHIEAHGSFEKYREAKGKLFEATKNIHIINIDDENSKYFLQFPAKKKYTYGLNKGDINTQNTKFKLKLIGEFNTYNALAAICIGLSQGISSDICIRALEKIEGIPGRMEMVISQPFKVIVDYAFTPNALNQVYKTIKNDFNPSQLICVLGSCGGGRDKWKRPVLGELAAKYCDKIIVTNEDPYDEDSTEIINQVASGTGGKAIKILDRREAIKESLRLAKNNDSVIVTGKGCESSICLPGGERISWDDRQVIREEFNKL